MKHQFIRNHDGRVMDEKLYGDTIINFLYSGRRENENFFLKVFSGRIFNDLLGFMNFDMPFVSSLLNNRKFLERNGVNLDECFHSVSWFDTPRKIFERQIRFWKYRPISGRDGDIVSPSDSKVIAGSLSEKSLLLIKNKFFNVEELVGKSEWNELFKSGDFAIFRLTPDKYHYNHCPVSGTVVDFFELDGRYYSCNPAAVTKIVIPYSKNRRAVTVIDTDVENGSRAGVVAVIEVAALMIGDIEQYYCEKYYENPVKLTPGMHVETGCVKSRFRPGSSTVIVLFEKDRINFISEIIRNNSNTNVESRYSLAFNQNIVETEINARETFARRSK
ncbi:MAG: phosphatidylserine decarboxylase [Spirochaetes bacterium]|nr:phosphatidylserine decarboxylase [Spirochaetota bacterium]